MPEKRFTRLNTTVSKNSQAKSVTLQARKTVTCTGERQPLVRRDDAQAPEMRKIFALAIHIGIFKAMPFTWDKTKRHGNLNKHGLDFADAEKDSQALWSCLRTIATTMANNAMKQTSTTTTRLSDADDAPKLTQADFERARFHVAGKEVSRAEWQAAVQAQVIKRRVNIKLDAPIIEHFKALAGERDYGRRINDTLRRIIEGEHRETDLRTIIRDELEHRFGSESR